MRKISFIIIFALLLGYIIYAESNDSMTLPSVYQPNDKDLNEFYYNYNSSQSYGEKTNIVYKVSSNFIHYKSKDEKLNKFIRKCVELNGN